MAERIAKPWGHELLFVHTDRYAGKLLVIEAGRRLSLQRHEQKDEAFYVQEGSLRFTAERGGQLQVEELGPGDSRHIPAGVRHRFEAVTRCVLFEVSTPELGDVVRLEDDYGRLEAPPAADSDPKSP